MYLLLQQRIIYTGIGHYYLHKIIVLFMIKRKVIIINVKRVRVAIR